VFTQQSIMFPGGIKASDLPIVTFEGHGHLAGYLALVFGGVITLWFKRNWSMFPVMILLVIAMSVSFNRASVVAAFIVTLLGWRTPKLVIIAMTIVVGGYFAGQKIIQIQQTGQARAITDGASSDTRKYLWKAGLAGFVSRPVTGYGGSLFSREWYKKLTFDELKTYFKLELGWNLITVFDKSKSTPVFDVYKPDGGRSFGQLGAVKIHNQILDMILMWGTIGVILYGFCVLYGIKSIKDLNFFGSSSICFLLFLSTWYASDQSHGVFVILSALSGIRSFNKN
jgi:O-antigen ligase